MFVKAGPLLKRLCLLWLLAALLYPAPSPAQFAVNPPLWHDPMGFSQTNADARAALDQGAQILELPADGSFAVAWFPPGYRKQTPRRLLYVLHGDGSEGQTGTAYEALLQNLPMAKKYGYGLVALQWRRTGDVFMDARDVQRVLSDMLPSLMTRYGVFPHMVGLETSGRSAEMAYEIAYWDKLSKRNLFRLIIAQSGGVPLENARPILARLLAEADALAKAAAEQADKSPVQPAQASIPLQARPPVAVASVRPTGKPASAKPAAGKNVSARPSARPAAKPAPPAPYPPGKALEGKQFFMYCNRLAGQADPQTCERMQIARRLVEGQAGKVVQFVEDPADGPGGMYANEAWFDAAVQAFLSATPALR